MWPFRNTPEPQEGTARDKITISPDDDLHTRVYKALRYSGFVNPKRLGTVDSVVFILREYERLDAEAASHAQIQRATTGA